MEVTKNVQKGTLSCKICKLKVFQKEEIIPSYERAALKNGSYLANALIYGVYIYAYPQIYNLTLFVLYPVLTNLKP